MLFPKPPCAHTAHDFPRVIPAGCRRRRRKVRSIASSRDAGSRRSRRSRGKACCFSPNPRAPTRHTTSRELSRLAAAGAAATFEASRRVAMRDRNDPDGHAGSRAAFPQNPRAPTRHTTSRELFRRCRACAPPNLRKHRVEPRCGIETIPPVTREPCCFSPNPRAPTRHTAPAHYRCRRRAGPFGGRPGFVCAIPTLQSRPLALSLLLHGGHEHSDCA